MTGTALGLVIDTDAYIGFGSLDHYTARSNSAIVFDVQHTRDALGRITSTSETFGGVTVIYERRFPSGGSYHIEHDL